jgi:hypothetical protein
VGRFYLLSWDQSSSTSRAVGAKDVLGIARHFEKVLYDNAQLARVYLHAWQVTDEPFHRAIVEETLDYVVREMTDPAGGFYSTQDADSEGEEGRFFVWTPDEICGALGDGAARFIKVYGGLGAISPGRAGCRAVLPGAGAGDAEIDAGAVGAVSVGLCAVADRVGLCPRPPA